MVICRFENGDEKFDRSLSSFISCFSDRFVGQLYDDTRWNCFDFVIEFMRFTNFRNFTKVAFVSEFMQKALNNAVSEMAEILEDGSTADSDRNMDQQSFAVSQFEIFTHEYRERKEVPQCDHNGSQNGSCCSSPSSSGDCKKRIVNATRKLQRAVLALQRMPDSDVIKDMLNKMREISNDLNEHTKQEKAEFSTKTVPLPDFDPTDMKLLLGESEVPPSRTPFEEVEESEQLRKDRLESLLFEAEVMLQEYDHIKNGLNV
ncbi:hypothetical protein ANCCAN_11379 [Ancylostoma caninum]|uniref:MKRN2 opposite strand protein-like C-terminal domain-containing protein n=1 Tax=Ancylostoma caninum TaxID=29170 RepID=A0A368GE49_ANCCA|nr:hypothetical protein ANCCAN_11379 [Ancylostoma caninum]